MLIAKNLKLKLEKLEMFSGKQSLIKFFSLHGIIFIFLFLCFSVFIFFYQITITIFLYHFIIFSFMLIIDGKKCDIFYGKKESCDCRKSIKFSACAATDCQYVTRAERKKAQTEWSDRHQQFKIPPWMTMIFFCYFQQHFSLFCSVSFSCLIYY